MATSTLPKMQQVASVRGRGERGGEERGGKKKAMGNYGNRQEL